MTALSVLEQALVRDGSSPGQPFRDAVALATHVETLGYRRFWIAEHHAMGAAASAAPEVLIGYVAAATTRLRVGSGAVLLPNHRPLHVAEVFRTLEALYPGRIDLGIGRSEGATDDAVVQALARPQDNGHGAGFDAQLDELLSFGGVQPLPGDHPLAAVRATPTDVPLPPVFLLGSSLASADTAARRGLGYGFAAYSNPDLAASALRRYRERFVATAARPRPHAILGLRVIIGEDDAHAQALALPSHLALVRHRAGTPGPLLSVDEAFGHRWTEAERAAEARIDTRADVVGGAQHAAERLDVLVRESHADEVIATTSTPDPGERAASLERLSAIAATVLPASVAR